MLHSKGAEQFARPPLGMCRRDTVRVDRGQTDIRDRREMFEQTMELEHHAYFPPELLEDARRDLDAAFERDIVHSNTPALEAFQSRDCSQDGRLARTGR